MSAKTLQQIQREGLDVLVERLGPDDAIRFLQIYEPGSGDWTKERRAEGRIRPLFLNRGDQAVIRLCRLLY